jgi:hypothetical protein
MASNGIDLKSPLFAQLSRGVQTKGIDSLMQAQSQAEKLKNQMQAQYFGSTANMLSSWPPAETTSTQSSSGGGGGK